MSISASDNIINQITLDCFMNKDQYNKYVKERTDKIINKKDRKFYRKRIVTLTKELLSEEDKPQLFPDVKNAFNQYINASIQYFKTLDTNDIIQEDYKDFHLDSFPFPLDNSNDNVYDKENTDKLMMRTIKIDKPSLENFIKRKSLVPPVKPIIPLCKDINLRDPILKTKGVKPKLKTNENDSIRKKKNIHNIYDNENKETKGNEKENENIKEEK